LTSEQKEKIKRTRLDSEIEKIRLKADLKIARLELRSLMGDEELDRADIYEKIEDIGELRVKLAKNRLDKRMALREILTKDQLEKLKERKHRKMIRQKLLKHRKPSRRRLPPRFPLLEEPSQQWRMTRLPSLAEEANSIYPGESLLEADELAEEAELARLLDELELAPLVDLVEPAPIIEEIELLPLWEEFPLLPEEPEIAPSVGEEDVINLPEK